MLEPSNILEYSPDQMNQLVEKYAELHDKIDWIEVLDLNAHARAAIISINVVDHGIESAYAQWGWGKNNDEMRFYKVEVKDEASQKHGTGTTMMKMVIAIARFYKASKITGTIEGEKKHLWQWYAKLGFTIYDQRKLLMELKYAIKQEQ